MKRKFFIVLLAITAAVCCAFGFTACDDNGGSGNAGNGGNNSSNSGNGSSSGSNGNNSDDAQPEFEKVAGSAGLEYTLSDDGTYYFLSGLGTCTDKDIVIANYYNDKPVTQIGRFTTMTYTETVENEEFNELDDTDEGFRSLVIFNKSYIKSVTIPEGITTIGTWAFAYGGGNCDDETLKNYEFLKFYSTLESVTMPKSVTTICFGAFWYCTALKTVNFSEGLTTIGGEAFYCCSQKLETITLPDSVKIIKDHAFWGIVGLKTADLGNGVEVIEDNAFDSCLSLESITIPVSVKAIEENTFDWCDKLKDIYYKGTKAQWNEIDLGEDWDMYMEEYTIHCTDGDIVKANG